MFMEPNLKPRIDYYVSGMRLYASKMNIGKKPKWYLSMGTHETSRPQNMSVAHVWHDLLRWAEEVLLTRLSDKTADKQDVRVKLQTIRKLMQHPYPDELYDHHARTVCD